MNPQSPPPILSRRSRPMGWVRVCLTLLWVSTLATAVVACALAYTVWSTLRVGPDAAALRNVWVEGRSGTVQKQLELSLGWVPCGVIRFGLGFVPLPREARMALETVKAAEVAVYEIHDSDDKRRTTVSTRFASADALMSKRGWDRLVGVIDRDQAVMVFVTRHSRSEHDLRFCVAVQERSQLVVVAAQTNLEPLMTWVGWRWPVADGEPLAGLP